MPPGTEMVRAGGGLIWRRSGTSVRAEVLLVHRPYYDDWSFPKGKLEPGETELECALREVKEETGLDVISATLFAIYSEARFVRKDMWGNYSQPLILAFRVDEWSGTLSTETDETVDARFVPAGQAPEPYAEVMADLARFDGQVILK